MFEEINKYLSDIDSIENDLGKLESIDRFMLMLLAIVKIFKLDYSTYRDMIIKKYKN